MQKALYYKYQLSKLMAFFNVTQHLNQSLDAISPVISNQAVLHTLTSLEAHQTLPWTAQSPGSDVLCSDTLGRT